MPWRRGHLSVPSQTLGQLLCAWLRMRTLLSAAMGRDTGEGEPILRKGSPSPPTPHPLFRYPPHLRQHPCSGCGALTALPLRQQGVVRLAVESLVSMVRRWKLSHDVGVNSTANPMGRILLYAAKVCVPWWSTDGSAARACGSYKASRRREATCGAGVGRDPRRRREVYCFDASVHDVRYILPH